MILIATCSEYPHPTPNLEALIKALRSAGAKADYLPWKTTPLETFAATDAVLPLCCWDYYDDPKRFLDWIEALEAGGARLINGTELLRWNFRKTYLLELAAAGLAIPRTFHLQDATREAVEQRMEENGWHTAVLKPVSSQGGHGLQKLVRGDRSQLSLDVGQNEVLLQEFQEDCSALGETTFTFIDGHFSHAVRRVLKAGEWRANPQHGITYERVEPDQAVIEATQRYLDVLQETPLYARVDGLVRPDGFMLMELELIDPYLYCEFAPGSAEVFAQALLKRIC
ncbi:RimK family alpha-L-glutamate ligase [Microvirga sp. 2YAF29]|uniref:ATP-grasp domain-containing protein n=1 Tax=Microvirga sp. 2YAF29 TaxID=3233031 RepID=UPI003F97818B